ncbi:hypothetical protein BT69DRAFT_1351226 [Atractiella rhizophila]|nr:hypothetical protein BT69DRAFT_1351226 [Atractiella rhizophila]
MAESAFQDEFTAQSGSNWIISLDSFPQQLTDAALFISKSLPQDAREPYIAKFSLENKDAEELAKVETKQALVQDLLAPLNGLTWGEGLDKELEGYVALLHHLLLISFPPTSEEYSTLVLALAKSLTVEHARPGVKFTSRYNALTTLFNSFSIPSRLNIITLLHLASTAQKNDDLSFVLPVIQNFVPYLTLCGFSPSSSNASEGASYLLQLEEIISSSPERDVAIDSALQESIKEFVEAAPSDSKSDTTLDLVAKLLVLAIRNPTFVAFYSLASLPTVRSFLSSNRHPAVAKLFQTILEGDVKDLKGVKVEGVTYEQAERKLRRLVVSDLATNKGTVSYDEVKNTLELADDDEVEIVLIDSLQSTLLNGKLNQRDRTLVVESAVPRSFSKDKWEALQSKLENVRASLIGFWSQNLESQPATENALPVATGTPIAV